MSPAIAIAEHTGATRADAVRAFRAEHDGRTLAPVVVVIAALDEADCIAEVLREIPDTACGLRLDTLVVDDGSTDGTSEVARACGVHVARLELSLIHI